MWWGSVMVVLSGFMMTLLRSGLTCSARRIKISREKACKRGSTKRERKYSARWNDLAFVFIHFQSHARFSSRGGEVCGAQKPSRTVVLNLLSATTPLNNCPWFQAPLTLNTMYLLVNLLINLSMLWSANRLSPHWKFIDVPGVGAPSRLRTTALGRLEISHGRHRFNCAHV